MKSLAFFSLVLAATSGASAAVLNPSAGFSCDNEVIAAETFIGANKDVKLTYSHCGDTPLGAAPGQEVPSIAGRQDTPPNVCGAPCDTHCFSPAGGGPNEADCTVLANSLLSDVDRLGNLFNATKPGTNGARVTVQYHSCEAFFQNQATTALTYCRTEWAALIKFLSPDCDAAHDAHGGLCVAQDQRWFVQVQNSSG